MKSKFDNDLAFSTLLDFFLDGYFYSYFVDHYAMIECLNRPKDLDLDYFGVDLICKTTDGNTVYIDQKAALDYKSFPSPLRTFAFELGSLQFGHYSEGWFTDPKKKTHAYALIWPHQNSNSYNYFDAAEIMIVNRKGLFIALKERFGISYSILQQEAANIFMQNNHSGYIKTRRKYEKKIGDSNLLKYVHSLHKAEKPLNLIIDKSILAEVAGNVFWVSEKNGVRSISADEYISPKSWSIIDESI